MNIALIFAGGVGQRMHSESVPKQFLKLGGKPILVYTIEHFQNSPEIDGIILVSLEDWIPYCNELIKKFGLTKVSSVIPGGHTGFASIGNGLRKAKDMYPDDSIVLIHDGVRPLIDLKLISDCIKSVENHGSAVTVADVIETIVEIESDDIISSVIDRSQCHVARAPQCFILNDIFNAHERAVAEGLEFVDSASLMDYYGYNLHAVQGPIDNIKITVPADFFVFKAYVEARENSRVFGV